MTLEMRPSRVLRQLRAGEMATCFKTNLRDARVAEIAAIAGFDCLWTCLEHVGNDWTAIEQQIWAGKSRDMDVLVRIPRGSYSDYVRPLELDAAAIMVPHVMSAEDARRVAYMTRFHPVGRRAVDGGNADALYTALPVADYIKQANAQRLVVVQIEDPEPLDEIDEIAAVPGIDMLFFGPADFSQGIGAPGVADDPRIEEARIEVARAAIAAGKFAGTVGAPESIPRLMEMGYRFITTGSDVGALTNYCTSLFTAVKASAVRPGK